MYTYTHRIISIYCNKHIIYPVTYYIVYVYNINIIHNTSYNYPGIDRNVGVAQNIPVFSSPRGHPSMAAAPLSKFNTWLCLERIPPKWSWEI